MKTFPRPYCEIGSNIKVLKKIFEKDNNFNDDLFLFKAFDIKYSGITNQLIFNFNEKKNKLKKINNGFSNINKNENNENYNFYFIKYENDKNIIYDIFEKKTFLKS